MREEVNSCESFMNFRADYALCIHWVSLACNTHTLPNLQNWSFFWLALQSLIVGSDVTFTGIVPLTAALSNTIWNGRVYKNGTGGKEHWHNRMGIYIGPLKLHGVGVSLVNLVVYNTQEHVFYIYSILRLLYNYAYTLAIKRQPFLAPK